jgi:hypothetical protein
MDCGWGRRTRRFENQNKFRMITDGSRLGHDHGMSMTFTAPSALRWKMPYTVGASRSGSRWVAKSSTPSGSSSVKKGLISVSEPETAGG